MLIYGTAIKSCITHCTSTCNTRIWIASAYCTRDAFHWLAKLNPSPQLDKRLVVRWQPSDIQQGSSDIEIWEEAQEFGWQLYINPQLHAKAHLFDSHSLIGSANLTSRGLGLACTQANLEIFRYTTHDASLTLWFESLFACSRLIDDALIQSIRAQLQNLPPTPHHVKLPQFDLPPVGPPSNRAPLTLKDLLLLPDPEPLLSIKPKSPPFAVQHDANLLNVSLPSTREALLMGLLTSKLYNWLLMFEVPRLYFGELSSALHNEIAKTSPIYRKTAKEYVANIFSWAKALPELFETGRSNNSEYLIIRKPSN